MKRNPPKSDRAAPTEFTKGMATAIERRLADHANGSRPLPPHMLTLYREYLTHAYTREAGKAETCVTHAKPPSPV